jgi:hypothetical protein
MNNIVIQLFAALNVLIVGCSAGCMCAAQKRAPAWMLR